MTKRMSFSDEIRRAIDESGLSRYEICKRLTLDQAAMSRFMSGQAGFSVPMLDRIADLLGIHAVAEKKSKRKGN